MTCDQPLASAKLVVDGNQPLEFALVPQDDPHLVQLDIKDVRSLVPSLDREPVTIHYHLEWTVSENEGKSSLVDLLSTLVGGGGGGEGEGEERTKDTDNGGQVHLCRPHALHSESHSRQAAASDRDPPGAGRGGEPAPGRAVINLKFIGVISDDYGVSKVDVLYWVNPAPDEEKPPLPARPPHRSHDFGCQHGGRDGVAAGGCAGTCSLCIYRRTSQEIRLTTIDR